MIGAIQAEGATNGAKQHFQCEHEAGCISAYQEASRHDDPAYITRSLSVPGATQAQPNFAKFGKYQTFFSLCAPVIAALCASGVSCGAVADSDQQRFALQKIPQKANKKHA